MAKRPCLYWSLAVREDGVWHHEYGSYVRKDVIDERLDYRDHDWKASDLRIVSSMDNQASIMAQIDLLNSEAT